MGAFALLALPLALAASPGTDVPMAGRPLVDVLQELRDDGARILYSSRLVREDMIVATEPEREPLLRLLHDLLTPHGLTVRSIAGGYLTIVRARDRVPPRRAASPDLTGTLRVLIATGDGAEAPGVAVTLAGFAGTRPTSAAGEAAWSGVAAGTYELTARASGGASARLPLVSVSAGDVTLVRVELRELDAGQTVLIALSPRAGFSETVHVEGQRPEPPFAPGRMGLSSVEMLSAPGTVDNLFRALQTLPAIEPIGELDSRLSVYGGAPDENLTLLDGVEIHNPYRLYGAVSGFNPEVVESVELHAGSYSLRYGDRLSSALEVRTRSGRTGRGLAGSASVSVTDANLAFEGRLPGRGSWIAAHRRTYYELVAERVLDDDLPGFRDTYLKLDRPLGAGARATLSFYTGRETADALFDDPADSFAVVADSHNDLAAATVHVPLGSGGRATSVLAWTRFSQDFHFGGDFTTDEVVAWTRRGAIVAGQRAFSLDRRASTRDLSFRQELAWILGGRHLAIAGFDVHALRGGWGSRIDGLTTVGVADDPPFLFRRNEPAALDSATRSTRYGAWVEARLDLGRNLAADAGLRLDHNTLHGRTDLSPRVGMELALGDASRLFASASYRGQSPGYEKLFQAESFVDLSGPLDGLESERATSLSLGLKTSLSHGIAAVVEGYYRRFSHLLIGRLESEAERDARVARYDLPASLAFALPDERQITTAPVSTAAGRAWGAYASLKKEPRGESSWGGWVSYRYGRSEREAYGRRFPMDADRPHVFQAVAALPLGPRFSLGVNTRLASGIPTTPPGPIAVAVVEDTSDRDGDGDTSELVPARDDAGRPLLVAPPGGVSELDTRRTPWFARTDVRLSFRPGGRTGRWLFLIEAFNVLGHRNASGYDYTIDLDPETGRPRVVFHELKGGLPLLPTIGVRFRF